MKAWEFSAFLAALMLAATTASAAAVEQRAALFCGLGRLDLPCAPSSALNPARAPLLSFAPLDARHADKAYIIRFGEGKKADAEPRWVVQLGSVARQILFWAAVASVLL